MQQGLRNMLPQSAVVNGGGGKHSTMDSVTQNMALQQLRGSAAVADAQTRLMSLQGGSLLMKMHYGTILPQFSEPTPIYFCSAVSIPILT